MLNDGYIDYANASLRKINRANRVRRNVHKGIIWTRYTCSPKANSTYLITHASNNWTVPVCRKSCHRFQSERTSRPDKCDHIVTKMHISCQTGRPCPAARWITEKTIKQLYYLLELHAIYSNKSCNQIFTYC